MSIRPEPRAGRQAGTTPGGATSTESNNSPEEGTMATTTRKPAEVPFDRIERTFQLAGYYLGGNYKPPVFQSRGGYGIRVLARQTSTLRSTTTSYDYFEINADGIVTASPRGWASQFNRKRVTGLAEAMEKYAAPDGGN